MLRSNSLAREYNELYGMLILLLVVKIRLLII